MLEVLLHNAALRPLLVPWPAGLVQCTSRHIPGACSLEIEREWNSNFPEAPVDAYLDLTRAWTLVVWAYLTSMHWTSYYLSVTMVVDASLKHDAVSLAGKADGRCSKDDA